jgi:hypothetical protein
MVREKYVILPLNVSLPPFIWSTWYRGGASATAVKMQFDLITGETSAAFVEFAGSHDADTAMSRLNHHGIKTALAAALPK